MPNDPARVKLSVIIVSYNVYPFLDNCLRSVRQAMQGIEGEIIVVDNASVDRTPQQLQEHFPDVKLIANPDNPGFAKANNQGIAVCHGEYVLLLNPDTVVSENTFTACIAFMDSHPDAGAVGVKMIDGSGRFLPESKRGLPTWRASFLKMTGLYRLASRSRRWNAYYQGHVGEDETARVEVLCGAFMFMRRSTLDQVGGLDEDFFMYGEDIDLSYRITRGGQAIYYLPSTRIIHYKGESTRKASLNYLLTFYEAMLIFTRKHPEFSGQRHLIRLAIYLHGTFRMIRQFLARRAGLMLDTVAIAGAFFLASQLWARYYFGFTGYFKPDFYRINLPLYTWLMALALFLNGTYDRPSRPGSTWRGFFTGILLILSIYALLPVDLRTSRMVIILGSACVATWLLARTRLLQLRSRENLSGIAPLRPTLIVAGEKEANRIKELINRSRDQIEVVGTVSVDPQPTGAARDHLGHLEQLADIVRVHQVVEIIFSAQDVPFALFTRMMTELGPDLRYMLAASTTLNIVGSMSKDTEGESYALRVHFNLSHPQARRAKRLFDGMASLVLLVTSPAWLLFTGFHVAALRSLAAVLAGGKTLVSYHHADPLRHSLPALPPGLLHPGGQGWQDPEGRRAEHIDYVYARDYHWTTDLSILFGQFRELANPKRRHG